MPAMTRRLRSTVPSLILKNFSKLTPFGRPEPGGPSAMRAKKGRRRLPVGESELPSAVTLRVRVGRAMQAAGLDARVDRARERLELDLADGPAREIREALAPAGLLDAAGRHEEAQDGPVPLDPARIHEAVRPEGERLRERVEAAVLRDRVRLHEPARLGGRKPAPGCGIQLEGDVHAVPLLGGEEPAPVVREPVLRENVEGFEETGAVELLECRRRRGARRARGL